MIKAGSERTWEEIGYLAYYFHWSLDDLLDLPHHMRDRFVRQVSAINEAESDLE